MRLAVLLASALTWLTAADGPPTFESLARSQRDAVVRAGCVRLTYAWKEIRDGGVAPSGIEDSAILAPDGSFLFTQKRFERGADLKTVGDAMSSFWCSAYVDATAYWYAKSGPVGGIARTSALTTSGRRFGRLDLVRSAVPAGMDQSVLPSPAAMCFEAYALHDRLVGRVVGANPRWCDVQDDGLLADVAPLFDVTQVAPDLAVATLDAEASAKYPNIAYQIHFQAVPDGDSTVWRVVQTRRSPYWDKPQATIVLDEAWLSANYELHEFAYAAGSGAKPFDRLLPSTITVSMVIKDARQPRRSAHLEAMEPSDPRDISDVVQELVLSASEVSAVAASPAK